MNRRVFSIGAVSIALLPVACENESEMLRYAKIAGIAAGSIGQIIAQKHPELGKQIVDVANGLVAAAEQWQVGSGTGALVVSALNALRTILETIPADFADQVASLIPIVIAAIEIIFAMLPQEARTAEPRARSVQPVVWHAAQIPHHFGNSKEKDFKLAWDQAAEHVQGAVIFK